VLKNSADDLGVFDAGNDLHRAAAMIATPNLDAEGSLHKPMLSSPATTICCRSAVMKASRS
jgi:hypothetical protein